MEVTSTWLTADKLGLVQESHAKEVHTFLPEAIALSKPAEDVSCSVTVVFQSPQRLLDVGVKSSARHVEVYLMSVNPLGERVLNYVDTIRGQKVGDLFQVAYAFPSGHFGQMSNGISFKFVSLQPPQQKDVLTLSEMSVRLHPSAAKAVPSPAKAEEQLPHSQSHSQYTSAPQPQPAAEQRTPIDMDTMKMIMAMQQAMQKQMEQKIYEAVDSRLSTLTKRLQSTETLIQNLTASLPKAEVKSSKDVFAGILDRLAVLEKEVRSIKSSAATLDVANAINQLEVIDQSTSETSSSTGTSSALTN